MQNGTRKGAGTQTMPTMRTSPGLEDIWQLHWGYGAGVEQNSAGVFIANIDEPAVIAGVLTAPPRGGGPGRGGPGAGGPGAGGPGAGGPGEPADRVQRHRSGPSAGGPGAGAPILVRRPRVGRASRKREDQQPAALLRRRVHHLQQVLSQGRRPGRTGRRARWRRRGGAYPGLLDQDFGGTERHVHGDEQPQQLQQDVHEALTSRRGSRSGSIRSAGLLHARGVPVD